MIVHAFAVCFVVVYLRTNIRLQYIPGQKCDGTQYLPLRSQREKINRKGDTRESLQLNLIDLGKQDELKLNLD